MPYNRPGMVKYVTNGGTAINHNQAVHNNGFVGVSIKQKAPLPTDSLATTKQIAANEPYAIQVKGVVQVPTVAGFAVGDPVYIITATNVLTETSAGNVKYGKVVEVAGERGTPTGYCRIDLDAKDQF